MGAPTRRRKPRAFGRRLAVVAMTTAMLLLLSGCGGQTQGATPTPDADTVYAQAERSLRSGGIYHATISERAESGDYSYEMRGEVWADLDHDVARQELVYTHAGGPLSGRTQKSVTLIADGVSWFEGRPQSTTTCHRASPVTSLVLGCPAPGSRQPSKTETGTYDGKSATVLIDDASFSAEDQSSSTTRTTYLDTDSLLPVAATVEGTMNDGKVTDVHRVVTYHGTFLPAGDVPATFFTPGSLGWHLPDPVADLPSSVDIYWLGTTYDPGGKLPSITFSRVQKSPQGPGYAAILTYNATADRFGPPVLNIQLWSRAAWDTAHVVMGVSKCAGVSDLKVGNAQVTLRCTKPDNEVTAFAQFSDAVVIVNAPSVQSANGVRRSPYAAREAILKLVGDLRVR